MLFPSGSLTGEKIRIAAVLGVPAFPEVVTDVLRTVDRAGVPVTVLFLAFVRV